jgi:hypothetical protein
MTGPYGHKPACPWQDEEPNEVTFEGTHGTRWRAAFTDDGRFARIRWWVPGDGWERPPMRAEDMVMEATALWAKGFWACARCGGFVGKGKASHTHTRSATRT